MVEGRGEVFRLAHALELFGPLCRGGSVVSPPVCNLFGIGLLAGLFGTLFICVLGLYSFYINIKSEFPAPFKINKLCLYLCSIVYITYDFDATYVYILLKRYNMIFFSFPRNVEVLCH